MRAKTDPALRWAAKQGDVAAIGVALGGGAAVDATDKDGGTALMLAARSGHAAAVEALARAGADLEATDKDGWTALMFAAGLDHGADAAAALLKAGADRAVKKATGNYEGKTALEIATTTGNEAVAALLR